MSTSRPPVGQRAERGVLHRQQRLGELLGGGVDRPPAPLLATRRRQLGRRSGGLRVGVLEHRVNQRAEGRARGQLGHRGGRSSSLGGRGARLPRWSRTSRPDLALPRRPCPRPPAPSTRGRRPAPRRGSARSTTCAATSVSTHAVERPHGERAGRLVARPSTALAHRHSSTRHRARLLPLRQRAAVASKSVGTVTWSGTAASPALRPNSSRVRPAVRGVPARRPPGDDLRLRPGQRDVGQPQLLAGALGARLARARPQPPTSIVRGAVVVVEEAARSRCRARAVEEERQVDDGVLQTLAPVDRDELHRRGVGVEPAGALVAAASDARSARSQSSSATSPSQSRCATSCSTCPRWSRSVSSRSPSGRASTRAASPRDRAPRGPRRRPGHATGPASRAPVRPCRR